MRSRLQVQNLGTINIPPHNNATRAATRAEMHPSFRSKAVMQLSCRFCSSPLCSRGQKAILLADTRCQLFSTDAVPKQVQLVGEDYRTRNCACRIKDIACVGCGNICGYHVTAPCDSCLSACNNGHFFMFHDESVLARERLDKSGTRTLLWGHLPALETEVEHDNRRDILCR